MAKKAIKTLVSDEVASVITMNLIVATTSVVDYLTQN